ncbi:DUF2442 domain-containing protein [Modestobacter sp. VKM Ac-2984]|uniref:DUF2442 domain-containing protein n=1 Tax=Modestobacter sp. VKM Ac-2984 TaxID=3004138 RepID=UPI0022AAE77E|nr:DUF2442 domain-containing protein [Modestobacter sp. VKM Ac-2984]MCZ2818026.1 DUF2442 domain-containing protein [Modestobacter sp. VKM Ac-2984]
MTTALIQPVPASAPPAGFTVLHVANDDDVVLRPASANDPDHGRIAVRVRPGLRRTDWLTRDLLAALGVDFTVTGAGRNGDENLQLLPVRLVAGRITDVLVAGAESLTHSTLTDLVLLAAAARARLWLVTAPPVTETVTTTLGDWCAAEVTVADTAAAWPGLLEDPNSPPDDPAAEQVPAPSASAVEPRQLPLVDATTLLAASRRLLTPPEATWVHRRLAAAVTDAGDQLDAATDPGDLTGILATWLLARYDVAGTLTQFLCDVRGLQVAGLWRGLLIQVDVPALLGTASAAPSATARTPEVWQRLRAYRLPVRAAACALAAARLGSAAICALTVADVVLDGTTVTTGGSTVTIEPDAACYLAEQRLLRLASGAPPDAPLLTTSVGTQLSDKGLARLLSEARTELGVVVTSRLVERQAPDGATTLRRWGVTVTALGTPVPGTPDTTPGVMTPAARATTVDSRTAAAAPLLDVDLLRRRKMELRLSRHDIAKRLGVTTAVVGRLESGANHAEQPLGLLLRLAGLLGLDLADLLPRHRAQATPPTVPAGQTTGLGTSDEGAEDVRLVGAALHALGVLVPTETLADVLGWTAERLAAAIDGLALTAPAAGLRVHRLQNRVSLIRAADALPAEALAAVLRYDAARTGLAPHPGAVGARRPHPRRRTSLRSRRAPPARPLQRRQGRRRVPRRRRHPHQRRRRRPAPDRRRRGVPPRARPDPCGASRSRRRPRRARPFAGGPVTTTSPGQPGPDAPDAAAVGPGVEEAGRLRAELTAVRAERDDLARRLAEALGEHRTAAGAGQLPLPGLTVPLPPVRIDLPLDVQSTSERDLPWAFADEARDFAQVRPGAYLLAGDEAEPVLVQVVEVTSDGRVHVRIVGPGPFIPADLNFEAAEPGTVWARVPTAGAPAVGAVVLAGSPAAWSWVRVASVEDGWLLLRRQAGPALRSARDDRFVNVTGVELAGGYTLRLTWADGAVTVVDVEPYLWGDVGAPLRDPELFATVIVDPEAGTVVWPATGLDISPVELRRVGRPVTDVAPPGLRTATRDQVLAAGPRLLHLADMHGLTDPGVDELGDLVVTLTAGEAGYQALRTFAAAAADAVGAWVNVVAADAPGAATATTPL